MNGVLNSLETKLSSLRSTLTPLQKATKDVALAENNINKAINELTRVVEYHDLTVETPEHVMQKRNLQSTGAFRARSTILFRTLHKRERVSPFF